MACSRRKFIGSVHGGSFASGVILCGCSRAFAENEAGVPQWVRVGKDGRLEYRASPRGDRIMDFSHAGYRGGGVALPGVPAKVLVSPSGKDDTRRIQAAIDRVSARPLAGGFRGAVQLRQGTFRCSAPLKISASGVVLRGSGSGKGGTIIRMAGEPYTCFEIGAAEARMFRAAADAVPVRVVDDYVPSGSIILTLEDTADVKVGDTVYIRRPVTAEWIAYMGMDRLVRDGKPQTWIRPGSVLHFERRVRAIRDRRIALDQPLSDGLDARFSGAEGATVVRASPSARIANVGVEGIRIVAEPPVGDLTVKKYEGIEFRHCEDGWVSDLVSCDPVTVVRINSHDCTRITLQDIHAFHTCPIEKGAGYPADFLVRGSRVLMDRCSAEGDGAFFYSSLGLSDSSTVLLHCEFQGRGSIQPHMRWNTGLLVDSCRVPEGGIEFINRRTAGSGHGWTIGWAVAWNCEAEWFNNQQPPGAVNWMIGCSGRPDGGTNFLSHGRGVDPESLYLAQLRERLGRKALRNIGYG